MTATAGRFYGWRVVSAAFVLAIFGWGIGFYGPPVFLSAVHDARGWPVALISTAVTVHFPVGALAGANVPALYRRFGVPTVTKAGALCLALGVFGWATAVSPWQLFVATALSGAGWGAMSAAALNAIVSPWFVRTRPAALAMAYNGGSIGGVIFSPLWVLAVGALGFASAAAAIGLAMDHVGSRRPVLFQNTATDGIGARWRCSRHAGDYRYSTAREATAWSAALDGLGVYDAVCRYGPSTDRVKQRAKSAAPEVEPSKAWLGG